MNKYWKLYGIILGIFVLLALAFAFKQKSSEQEFLSKAYHSNQYQVAVSKLANEKSSSDEIKTFGAMLVSDHQKFIDEMQHLAKSMEITFSEGVDEKYQNKLEMFSKIDSSKFDQAFKLDVIAMHEEAITLFEQASIDRSITSTELKNWIIIKLPILKAHLDKAKTLNMAVGKIPISGILLHDNADILKSE